MADNRTLMSTCPICGYTDTADDAEVLNMAIVEHIRMSHNLDAATLGGTTDSIKPVSDDQSTAIDGSNANGPSIPIIAASPNNGVSGPDGTGSGYGPGAGLLISETVRDNEDNRADDTGSQRNDETSRF